MGPRDGDEVKPANAGAAVSSIAYSPDGETLAAGDGKGPSTRGSGTAMRAAGTALYMVSGPQGRVFATGDLRGHVAVWNAGPVSPSRAGAKTAKSRG